MVVTPGVMMRAVKHSSIIQWPISVTRRKSTASEGVSVEAQRTPAFSAETRRSA